VNHRDFDRLVAQARTFRRFRGEVMIDGRTLRELIDLVRLSPSSRNMQPLKFIPVNEARARDELFHCLKWAGALKGWAGPSEDERPAGYIVILGDSSINSGFSCDHGIAAQTMKLGAQARGFGSCIIASIDRDRLHGLFGIDRRYEILLVLALGAPAEQVMIEPLPADGAINYWRDDNDVHHVPKRSLEEIILKEFMV